MSLKKGLLLIKVLLALLFPLKIFQTSRVMADVNSRVQSPEGQGLDQQSVMLLTEREQVLWQAEAVESGGGETQAWIPPASLLWHWWLVL